MGNLFLKNRTCVTVAAITESFVKIMIWLFTLFQLLISLTKILFCMSFWYYVNTTSISNVNMILHTLSNCPDHWLRHHFTRAISRICCAKCCLGNGMGGVGHISTRDTVSHHTSPYETRTHGGIIYSTTKISASPNMS